MSMGKHNNVNQNGKKVGTLGRQESSLIGLVRPLNWKNIVYMFYMPVDLLLKNILMQNMDMMMFDVLWCFTCFGHKRSYWQHIISHGLLLSLSVLSLTLLAGKYPIGSIGYLTTNKVNVLFIMSWYLKKKMKVHQNVHWNKFNYTFINIHIIAHSKP